ncbi:hypothetical protein ACOMHN_023443 [Nucella lapillus]
MHCCRVRQALLLGTVFYLAFVGLFLFPALTSERGNSLREVGADHVQSNLLSQTARDVGGNVTLLDQWERPVFSDKEDTRRRTSDTVAIIKHDRDKGVLSRSNPDAPGYGGRGHVVDKTTLDTRQREDYDEGYRRFHANVFVSDLISLHRTVDDVLEPECKARQYAVESLPSAGVVVVFHNEAWSILLRTVHSVLAASPPSLLTELVLVDDASDLEHLGRPLEDYVALLDRVKLVRLPGRLGLMQARMAGFRYVTGRVAAFLDSHCEVPKGWLEPLLARIAQDENVLAVPATDVIDSDTFQYRATGAGQQNRGGFDLDLYFMWIPQSAAENARRGGVFEPMRSPTHLGCCFAMAKSTFLRLGLYDPGLRIWGCENMELSFKTWMCGGSVEIIPCSHVGHMFRYTAPYSWGPDGDVLTKNCMRVAQVWMDDYRLLYQDRIFYRQVDYGDVTERKALRKELGCRSFQWYLHTVYPELYIPIDSRATGQVQNRAAPSLCMEAAIHYRNNTPVSAALCNTGVLIQHFTLTREGQMRRDEGCLDTDDQARLVVRPCDEVTQRQGWRYLESDELWHTDSGKCLTLGADDHSLLVMPCGGRPRQKWTWQRRSLSLPAQTGHG